jgi:ATP-dependent DNA ligase
MQPQTTRTPRASTVIDSHDRWATDEGPQAREVEFSVLPFPQRPMLARSVTSLPDEADLPGGSAYEPKFDGYRALVFVEAGACRIQSRQGRDITASFPEIAAAALENLPSGVVVDGELVVWGDDVADFTELHHRLDHGADHASASHPASFIAFDVLAGAGMDMRRSPFRVRRQALTILLDDAPAPLHVVPQTRDVHEARTWMLHYAEAHVGVEGVVAKGLSTPYAAGERGWAKMRVRESLECVVGAVTGSMSSPERLVVGLPDADGVLHVVGCTTEMTLPHRRRLAGALADIVDTHPWPPTMSTDDVPGWVGPGAVLTMVEPAAVVEIAGLPDSSETWSEPRELIRSRPELRVADLLDLEVSGL